MIEKGQKPKEKEYEDKNFWFYFADIDESEDMCEVAEFVSNCYNGKQALSQPVNLQQKGEVQWILMQASSKKDSGADDDDVLVAVARLVIEASPKSASSKLGYCDVICAVGNNDKCLTVMLQKVEIVAYHAGVEELIINTPSWRLEEMEEFLQRHGYADNCGFLQQTHIPFLNGKAVEDETEKTVDDNDGNKNLSKFEVKLANIDKEIASSFEPTMILGFCKNLPSACTTKISESVSKSISPDDLVGDLEVLEVTDAPIENLDNSAPGDTMKGLMKTLFSALHAEADQMDVMNN